MNRLINDDVRKINSYLHCSDPIVDLIITSPPYWDLLDYGGVDGQIGYGQSKQQYLDTLKTVLDKCYNITKETGSLWLILDTYRRNQELELLPLELSQISKDIGWKLRELIVWDKQYSLPWHQKGQMRNASEYILFFTKSDNYKFYIDRIKNLDEISKWWIDFPERFNPKGKTPTNIWRFPIRRRGTWPHKSTVNHLCPFPTGLVARIIDLTSDEGDLVFDPFAGSGVVLAMAENLNRNYLGFEINSEYVEMYEDQVKKTVAEEWQSMLAWREILQRSKADFEITVMNLRVIKYSWHAIKAIQEVLDDEEFSKIKAAICIAEIPRFYLKGERINIQIWFLGEKNHRFFKRGIAKVRERLLRPPLTYYGISAEVFSGSISHFFKTSGVNRKEEYYLYPYKKAKKFFQKDRIQDLIYTDFDGNKNSTNGLMLITNIAEDVSWVLE